MAPEQIQRQACAASDQYALGIVVYEWLTGQTPFRGMLYEVISHHLYQPPPSLRAALPDLPVAAEEAVFKALAKDPVQRFASVTDFASALEEASFATQPCSLYGPGWSVMTPSKVSEAERAPDDLTVAPSPSGSPLYGVPQHNVYEPLNSYAVPLQAPPSPPPRRLSVGLTALMVGVVFLLLAGSGGIYYATVFRPNQLHAQASSTAEMQRTATIHAQQGTAISQAQQEETATALANTPQGIYNRATSGSPVLDDPLSHNDDNNWDESHTATYSCTFSGGAYHASLNVANRVVICPAYATTFRNVAYQVQMTLIKGDRGGILFRFTGDKFSGYSFTLASDGTYALSLLQGTSQRNVRSGSSSFIKTGLKQSNLLTVVASGSDIYLYVNKQFVTSLSDTTFSSGQIGVQASEDSLPTEVVFRNAQVWNV